MIINDDLKRWGFRLAYSFATFLVINYFILTILSNSTTTLTFIYTFALTIIWNWTVKPKGNR